MKIATAVLTLALGACALGPTTFEPVPADVTYGSPPANPEMDIRDHMETVLRDSESARYKIGSINRAYAHELLQYGGRFKWAGYRVFFDVNSKNAYGGYTGYQPYVALYSNGKIIRVLSPSASTWTFTSVND